MRVYFKKLDERAVLPSYASIGDAGLDLTAITVNRLSPSYIEYGTGLAVEVPEGCVGLIFPRSSVSNKRHFLANSVGVVDSGYRGELTIRFRNISSNSQPSYEVGERVAQFIILPYPQIQVVESDTLSQTSRGYSGFGSTGL